MNPVVHGWYRTTDIMWEWQKVIPEEAVQPLKSFIHSECITCPEHPFYNPTVGGVELFVGVLRDNESRLLYSSKQIEYLRYWIKAMGLLDYLIPLPNTEYLLTRDMLNSVAPVVIKTAIEMKQHQKQIDKLNKRLRGAVDPRLAGLRQIFERVRASYGSFKGTWIAADFEAWEYEHQIITEFGFAEMKWLPAQTPSSVDGKETSEANAANQQQRMEATVTRTGHWILQEHKSYRNGAYVQDNRDLYAFGKSEVIPKVEFIQRIKDLIQPENPDGPIFLIFHAHSQDLKYLIEPKYQLEILAQAPTLIIPDVPPESGTFIIDTQQLFSALEGDGESQRKLEDVYRRLKHETRYDFHNAGNDAKYTLDVLQEMANGGPLDVQRERRWPPPPVEPGQAPKKTVKVEDWKPEDESDYEDTEMALGGGPEWRRMQALNDLKAKAALEANATSRADESDDDDDDDADADAEGGTNATPAVNSADTNVDVTP